MSVLFTGTCVFILHINLCILVNIIQSCTYNKPLHFQTLFNYSTKLFIITEQECCPGENRPKNNIALRNFARITILVTNFTNPDNFTNDSKPIDN